MTAIGEKPIIEGIETKSIDDSQDYLKNLKPYFSETYQDERVWVLEYFDKDYNDFISLSESTFHETQDFEATLLYKTVKSLEQNQNSFHIWWASNNSHTDVEEVSTFEEAIELIKEQINRAEEIGIRATLTNGST
ncbi:MAG: hypothetical protein AAGA18_06310 [Verrucomicrobiota bacterium]